MTNLERVGDEARKISESMRRISESGDGATAAELKKCGEMAYSILHRVLDAFARMDTVSAAQIVRDDKVIDEAYRALSRRLVIQMNAAPRTIPVALEYLFIGKAFERIGDHAKNIAELLVFVVKGRDMRHIPVDELERAAFSD